MALEVDVLDPEGQALHLPQAAAVHGLRDEPVQRLQVIEDGGDLAARQHRGEVMGTLGPLEADQRGDVEPEDAPVQEDKGAEGLVLGGGRRVPLDGEVVEEGGDVGGAELARVAAIVEGDVGADPVDVRLLGARRIVQAADGRGDGFEQRHAGGLGADG
jgi:hypothetical protein